MKTQIQSINRIMWIDGSPLVEFGIQDLPSAQELLDSCNDSNNYKGGEEWQ